MPTYTRKYSRYSRETGRKECIESYEQPLVDRLTYLVYRVWWRASYKFKPLSYLINHVAEPIASYLHNRKCNDDCGQMSKDQMQTWIPACTRFDIDIQQAFKLNELDSKNNRNRKPV